MTTIGPCVGKGYGLRETWNLQFALGWECWGDNLRQRLWVWTLMPGLTLETGSCLWRSCVSVATFSCLLEPFFPPPVYTVQKSVCTNFLPGVVEEAFAFFSHGPPIAPFLCSTVSEQGSVHGSCSIFGGQCLLNLHSCHAHWFPRLCSSRICKFPGSSPEF